MIIYRTKLSGTEMNIESRFAKMIDELRAHGHRLTPQRVAIAKLLASSTEHPSAAQIYDQIIEQFPTTSLATVYKTLAILKELGLVLELGFSQDDNRYDGVQPYPHPHLICVRCRKIIDADVEPVADLASKAAKASGYQLVGHRMEFYGICPECQNGT